jgi:hypothetical protein
MHVLYWSSSMMHLRKPFPEETSGSAGAFAAQALTAACNSRKLCSTVFPAVSTVASALL